MRLLTAFLLSMTFSFNLLAYDAQKETSAHYDDPFIVSARKAGELYANGNKKIRTEACQIYAKNKTDGILNYLTSQIPNANDNVENGVGFDVADERISIIQNQIFKLCTNMYGLTTN